MAWSGSTFSDMKQFGNRDPVQTSKNTKQPRLMNINSSVAPLENLNIGTTANVVGVVIAKEDTKSIFSKKAINCIHIETRDCLGKGQGTERFLLSFTIRDSPENFVNCTCWGSENFINDLARLFSIGDTVRMENAQVQQNPTDGTEEKFRVSTPLPFHLTLSENHSSLTLYTGLDLDAYSSLQHLTTKSNSDYYTLEDVLANDQNLNGEHINILAAVRKVGPAKDITTKTGKHTKRCEIKLFDESCQSFPLILWGEQLATFVQTWTPYETVVFVADIRMNYDHYRNSMVATADSKTVLTVNPDTVDARCLYQYATTQNFSGESETDFTDPPLNDIKEIRTVKQLSSNEGTSDYAVVYGVITKFDLDVDNPDQFFIRKCTRCKKLVNQDSGYKCMNPECNLGALQMFNTAGQVTLDEPELDFRMYIAISDHTGTVSGRLTASVIETMTGMKVNDLFALDIQKRTDMKWHYLLERCKLHVKLLKNFRDQDKPTIRILSCSRADIAEVENSIVQF